MSVCVCVCVSHNLQLLRFSIGLDFCRDIKLYLRACRIQEPLYEMKIACSSALFPFHRILGGIGYKFGNVDSGISETRHSNEL